MTSTVTTRRLRRWLAVGALLAPVVAGATAVGRAEAAPVSAGGTIRVHARALAGLPPTATAVVMNVTVTEPTADGFVTAYPCNGARPLASNLNYVAGQTIPNLVVAKLDAQGDVCLFSKSATHLVADVAGWFPDTAAFTPLAVPTRAFDSRDSGDAGRVPELGERAVTVAGRFGVPTDARAVVVNVTVTEPVAPGYVTLWPCGEDRPLASNLNYRAGETIPNLAVVRPGSGGQVCIFSQSVTHVVVDVAGYLPPTSGFVPLTAPTRLVDTRPTLVGSDEVVRVQVAGTNGVPNGAAAAVLNVTAAEAALDGFLTVWPCDGARPLASNVNYARGQNIPNLVFAGIGSTGEVCVYAKGTTGVVVDLSGWFPTSASYESLPTPLRVLDTRRVASSVAAASVAVPFKPTYALGELFTVTPASAEAVVTAVDSPEPTRLTCSYAAGVITFGPASPSLDASCTFTVQVVASATVEPSTVTQTITFLKLTPTPEAPVWSTSPGGNRVLTMVYTPGYTINDLDVSAGGSSPCDILNNTPTVTGNAGRFTVTFPLPSTLVAGCTFVVKNVLQDGVFVEVPYTVTYPGP